MGSPISTWEGASAYYTSAGSGGVLMFWLALAVVAVIGAIVHTSLHEDKSATAVRNGHR